MTTQSTDLIPMTQVAEVLLHGGTVDTVDPEAVQADMVRRILSSESLSDAFANFEAVPARDIEGVLLDVTGVAWMRSAFRDGPGVYALLQCHLVEAKRDVVVSMGGRTTMASFLWAQQHEAMPIRGAFVSSRSNSDPERQYWTFKMES